MDYVLHRRLSTCVVQNRKENDSTMLKFPSLSALNVANLKTLERCLNWKVVCTVKPYEYHYSSNSLALISARSIQALN